MKVYDCITFFDENLLTKLRFNILDGCVEKFIVCESKYDHKGKYKGLNFNINNYKKLKEKIIHLVIDKQFPDISSPWKTQIFQREFIMNALKEVAPEDYIMYSDSDEIPNPEILKNLKLKKKYGIFLQKMFCYKLNIYNSYETPWQGTRICLKRNLNSFDFLRYKIISKNLDYPFWRIDKEKNIQLIENGGWHFNCLMNAEQISTKLKTFAHEEFNKDEFTKINFINEKINKMKDLFNRGHQYNVVKLDSSFPKYILDNKNQFMDWIK